MEVYKYFFYFSLVFFILQYAPMLRYLIFHDYLIISAAHTKIMNIHDFCRSHRNHVHIDSRCSGGNRHFPIPAAQAGNDVSKSPLLTRESTFLSPRCSGGNLKFKEFW
jgi:hypothetical protein